MPNANLVHRIAGLPRLGNVDSRGANTHTLEHLQTPEELLPTVLFSPRFSSRTTVQRRAGQMGLVICAARLAKAAAVCLKTAAQIRPTPLCLERLRTRADLIILVMNTPPARPGSPGPVCQAYADISLTYSYGRVNTLTSMQYFYSIFGPMSVDRLPCTVKGPFKAIRYYLGGQTSIVGV
jgi:hypothetical protein